ncbi:MAG: hypothetical protein ACR2JY_15280 [Chloroflexota bacterium]
MDFDLHCRAELYQYELDDLLRAAEHARVVQQVRGQTPTRRRLIAVFALLAKRIWRRRRIARWATKSARGNLG